MKVKHSRPQKTEEERANFMKKFALIINGNMMLKNNYAISFADVNYATRFYITTRDNQLLDLMPLLTKPEYAAYTDLIAQWKN